MRVIHKVQDEHKLLELSLSDDKQKLFAKVEPREKYALATLDEIVRELIVVSRPELIEKDVVRDIAEELTRGRGCESRRVAQGRPPGEGKDGKVVWLARRFCPGKNSAGDREFSDFFTMGLFENIEAGAEIARVYKPTAGSVGVDVQGKEIVSKTGKSVATRWDSSIELRQDPQHESYTTAVARISGYIHDEGASVAVRDTILVPKNLDWNFGHIDFVGHVKIGGDVQKGFHIKARGNIDIKGGVIGENILASKGSIAVKGCHLGVNSSAVSAGGDYAVGIAHGVSATVGGNIFIEREARDCSLSAGAAVFALRAAIVGGSVWCVCGLEAKTLGNEAGVSTLIELKNELEVTKEYRTLAASIRKHETALAALELHIGPYLKNRRRVPLLKREFKVKIGSLLEKYDGVVSALCRLREQEREMRESKPVQTDARISVSGQIHPGVVLTCGERRLEIKETIKGPISFRCPDHQAEWQVEKFHSVKKG